MFLGRVGRTEARASVMAPCSCRVTTTVGPRERATTPFTTNGPQDWMDGCCVRNTNAFRSRWVEGGDGYSLSNVSRNMRDWIRLTGSSCPFDRVSV